MKKLNVLVACESSGVVRDAFTRLGHNAMSCDLLPSSAKGEHYEGNVFDLDLSKFDLMIAHPPCTYLSVSGMHWTTRGLRDPQLTEDALDLVNRLLEAPIDHICIENPVSVISTRIRKPDQIIQPWMFGHDASKKTCLWLKELPKLVHGKIITPNGFQLPKFASDCSACFMCEEPFCDEHAMHFSECACIGDGGDAYWVKRDGYEFISMESNLKPTWSNQTPSGQNKLGPSKDRWKQRSQTYEGIADAMAKQWSDYLIE